MTAFIIISGIVLFGIILFGVFGSNGPGEV